MFLSSVQAVLVNIFLQVAQFQVYFMVVTSIIPALMQFYIGAWADIFGRKRLMYIYLMATIVGSVISVLNSAFIMWPKEYIILSQIPLSLVGGFPVWVLSQFSFIADISEPDQRAFRMGMIFVASSLGSPVAPLVGAALFDAGNRFRPNGKKPNSLILIFSVN